ncbi:MAG: hypothetical protein M0Q26_10320, partial [Chitinophagaceae bacterium]|nr:hypothetical protein [Chitinophagaceae bacterium]
MALAGMLFILTMFFSCKKEKTGLCQNVSSRGRIIGYDPCRYYTPINKRKDAGFVIEIDNGIAKDTVVNYSIPEHLFLFPLYTY